MEPIQKIMPEQFQRPGNGSSITERPSTTGSLTRLPLTQQLVAKALVVLTTHFPNLELTRDKITIYHEALKDLSEEQLTSAIKTFCLAHEEIYPGTNIIAKIRGYGLGHHLQETAAEAWEKVSYGARRGGTVLDNAVAEKVVRCMGGWHELGRSETPVADRAHFMRMYNEERARQNFMASAGEMTE